MTIIATPVYGGGEKVTLSGTASVPNEADCSRSSSFGSATGAWRFLTNGRVNRTVSCTEVQFEDGIEWTNGQDSPQNEYWIRATVESGNAPGGSALNTWLKVAGSGSANRSWSWTKTLPGTGSVSGTIKVEIASDAAGSNILATGYYKGTGTLT